MSGHLEHLQGWRFSSFSGQPMSVLITLLVKSIFPYIIIRISCVSTCAIVSCPIAGHLQDKSMPLFSVCSDQVVSDSNNVSLSFFFYMLNRPTSHRHSLRSLCSSLAIMGDSERLSKPFLKSRYKRSTALLCRQSQSPCHRRT